MAKKTAFFYFISYEWNTSEQSGKGNIEISIDHPIESMETLNAIKKHIEEHFWDDNKNQFIKNSDNIHVLILNFVLFRKERV